MRLFHNVKSNFFNVFMLKCVSVTNLNAEHDMEGAIT